MDREEKKEEEEEEDDQTLLFEQFVSRNDEGANGWMEVQVERTKLPLHPRLPGKKKDVLDQQREGASSPPSSTTLSIEF